MPALSTASSHACSLSWRIRDDAIQRIGLNQYADRTTSASICTSQSPRAMCASSWHRTMRMRSAGQASAPIGRMISGASAPHVTSSVGWSL